MIRTGEFSDMRYAGKKGFISIAAKKRTLKSLNLIQLTGIVEKLAREKKLRPDEKVPTIDLKEYGYAKLLGTGSLSRPISVKVEKCSASALRKLKDAGGDAILNKPSET